MWRTECRRAGKVQVSDDEGLDSGMTVEEVRMVGVLLRSDCYNKVPVLLLLQNESSNSREVIYKIGNQNYGTHRPRRNFLNPRRLEKI